MDAGARAEMETVTVAPRASDEEYHGGFGRGPMKRLSYSVLVALIVVTAIAVALAASYGFKTQSP